MKIIQMTKGRPFDMGLGDTRNVIGAHTGAKCITFNYAKFKPGVAFKPHIHEKSEDVILVLAGTGWIRRGEKRLRIKKWDVIHVSAGEYHGTIAGPKGLTCVSCQAPIDLKLFKGGAQPKKAGKGKKRQAKG
jgi:quercetin dioxygenase-like cupin family protein